MLVVFQPKKNLVKGMSDSDEEGPQQTVDVPPAPNPSDYANEGSEMHQSYKMLQQQN